MKFADILQQARGLLSLPRLWKESKKVDNEKSWKFPTSDTMPPSRGVKRKDAASLFKVDGSTIDFASKVIKKGTPVVQEAVETGQIAVSDAANIIDEPEHEQNQAV